ncbi:MAG TPA: HEAT repeat domain-containing protein [Phycisphaerae bacterium]|nr:HEAT repeat domain-containing protein [Phycisphaerae bacterium]
MACWLVLLSIAHEAAAAPAWPTPPRNPSKPTSSPTSGPRETDQNLALIKGNNTADARKLGALRLLEIGGPDASNALAEILRQKPADLPAQVAVCAALIDGPQADPALLQPLLDLLGDPRPGLEDVLVSALQRFDRSQVVERLRPAAVESSQGRPKRLAAIAALGSMGDEKNAVAVLRILLDDPSRSVQGAALAAFSQATGIAHPDSAAAKDWWEKHSQMSTVEWLRTVSNARNGQVRALSGEKTELTRRLTASYREFYLQTPEPARPPYLKSLLTDALPAVRSLGLDLINDLITDRKEIDPALKPLVAGTLVDPDPKVRMRAARMVSDLRLSVGLARLTDALGRELVDEVRAAQVAALGRLDDLLAIPVLTERLTDESGIVVVEAATALGNLARRGRAERQVSDAIARVLLERFEKVATSDAELREKLLMAMANIDAPGLWPVFERELRADNDVGLRRAAMIGLAAGGDAAVAPMVRPLLASSEPELRLAAVDALAKCGRLEVDLDALSRLLNPEVEPDLAVRQRAWDAFLAVLQHAAPDKRLAVADSYNLPDDKIAQRRQLDILKTFRADAVAYESLSDDQRLVLLEKTARAQLQLAEFSGAAATLEQATSLLRDLESPRYAAISTECVAALLKGREDEHAVRRLMELSDGQPINGELTDLRPLTRALRDELEARITAADDAVDLESALKLTMLSAEFAESAGPDFAQDLAVWRTRAMAKRDNVIDGLLSQLAGDPDAEARLMKDNPQAVLSRIYQKLAGAPESVSTSDEEERLVRLARRLAPKWEGYSADTTPENRTASLNDLRDKCAAPEAGLVSPPHTSTSAPAEKKIGLHTVKNSSEL